MKRFAFLISIMAMFAAMFMLSSCEKNKLPEGTGSLAVHVGSPKYDCEVRVYPYVADDLPQPIASKAIKAGACSEGNYRRWCHRNSASFFISSVAGTIISIVQMIH